MHIEANITENKITGEHIWTGGTAWVFVIGTFDGANVQLNAGQDALPKLALDNAFWTEPAYNRILLPTNGEFDFTIANVGASTDITISVLHPAVPSVI